MSAGNLLVQHQDGDSPAGRPTELLAGIGSHSDPIFTQSELAQRYFDQGLALLYGFNQDEAARLFARAAELGPASPMPHWGIAYALGPNYNLPAMPEREEKPWQAIAKSSGVGQAGSRIGAGLRSGTGAAVFERSQSRPEPAGRALRRGDGRRDETVSGRLKWGDPLCRSQNGPVPVAIVDGRRETGAGDPRDLPSA